MMKNLILFFCLLAGLGIPPACAQEKDTVFRTQIAPPEAVVRTVLSDSAGKGRHSPRKATFRSAVLPGWGQAYNREYWKIPLVYGALSIPAITWSFNNKWYRRTREAFQIRADNDSTRFTEIHPKLERLDAGSLLRYRNQYRRDRDFSVLWFFIVWGVNVVDATVFAHLKEFNVSDDLSLKIFPKLNPKAAPELGLVLGFRQKVITKTPVHF